METYAGVISHDDIIDGYVGVGGQEKEDDIWVSAGSHDVYLLNFDEEYVDSPIGSISWAELVNAQEQEQVVGRVLNFKKKGTSHYRGRLKVS